MHALQNTLEQEWVNSRNDADRWLAASLGAYSIIMFCDYFRGSEFFLVDLQGLQKYLAELKAPDKNYDIVPLLGRFKGETGEKYHLMHLAAETTSRLWVKEWIKWLVFVRELEGRVRGPAFYDKGGIIARSKDCELPLMDRLVGIQERGDYLIPRKMDICKEFGISHSFCKGAASTARVRGVTDQQVDLINLWRTFESANRCRLQLSMQDHYSDIQILIPELKVFSRAL